MIRVCVVGVAKRNTFVGLHEPSVLELKAVQFGPSSAVEIPVESNSKADPRIKSRFMKALANGGVRTIIYPT
jgi:hypothetical protein